MGCILAQKSTGNFLEISKNRRCDPFSPWRNSVSTLEVQRQPGWTQQGPAPNETPGALLPLSSLMHCHALLLTPNAPIFCKPSTPETAYTITRIRTTPRITRQRPTWAVHGVADMQVSSRFLQWTAGGYAVVILGEYASPLRSRMGSYSVTADLHTLSGMSLMLLTCS